MRKLASIFLVVMLIATIPFRCDASQEEHSSVIYFEDGSYLVESIWIQGGRSIFNTTGTKTTSYHSKNGTIMWQAILTGVFIYNGMTATCTSSVCTVEVFDSAWYTISKSAGKSAGSATATVQMGEKLLGVTISTKTENIRLTCDPNGNLS